MRVVDGFPQSWYLLQHDADLLFSVNCEHSFIGYDFTMKLNADEVTHYEQLGRDYLSGLAEAINYSCPIARDSASIYKERNVDDQYSKAIQRAVEDWRLAHHVG
jgi:hypothetical protein